MVQEYESVEAMNLDKAQKLAAAEAEQNEFETTTDLERIKAIYARRQADMTRDKHTRILDKDDYAKALERANKK